MSCHNVRKRQFEENLPRGAVPGRIWRNIVFVHILQKKLQTAAEKGSLNRPIPLLIFINCDPLSDHSKSKAQTTKVQQPRPCLQFPFAKTNYLAKQEKKQENISFSSLPDGKSASRNYSTPASWLLCTIMCPYFQRSLSVLCLFPRILRCPTLDRFQ